VNTVNDGLQLRSLNNKGAGKGLSEEQDNSASFAVSTKSHICGNWLEMTLSCHYAASKSVWGESVLWFNSGSGFGSLGTGRVGAGEGQSGDGG